MAELIRFEKITLKYQVCSLCDNEESMDETASNASVVAWLLSVGWVFGDTAECVEADWVCPECRKDECVSVTPSRIVAEGVKTYPGTNERVLYEVGARSRRRLDRGESVAFKSTLR